MLSSSIRAFVTLLHPFQAYQLGKLTYEPILHEKCYKNKFSKSTFIIGIITPNCVYELPITDWSNTYIIYLEKHTIREYENEQKIHTNSDKNFKLSTKPIFREINYNQNENLSTDEKLKSLPPLIEEKLRRQITCKILGITTREIKGILLL